METVQIFVKEKQGKEFYNYLFSSVAVICDEKPYQQRPLVTALQMLATQMTESYKDSPGIQCAGAKKTLEAPKMNVVVISL